MRFTIQINAVSTRFISTGKTFNVSEIEKKDTADFTDGVSFYSLSRRGGVYVTIAIIGPIILTRFQVESLEQESKQAVAIEFLIYFIT